MMQEVKLNGAKTMDARKCEYCDNRTSNGICQGCADHQQKQLDLVRLYELSDDDIRKEMALYVTKYSQIIKQNTDQTKSAAKRAAKDAAAVASPFIANVLLNRGRSKFQGKRGVACEPDAIADEVSNEIKRIMIGQKFAKWGGTKVDGSKVDRAKELLGAWFKDRKKLRASFTELEHFTGISPSLWSQAVTHFKVKGWKFERNDGDLHVVFSPENKTEKHQKLEQVLGKELSKEDYEAFISLVG